MELYCTSEQEKKRINSSFNITEEEIAEKFKLLKEWVESTPHLPLESKEQDFLQIMPLRGKFNVDQAKTKIENYFSYISRYPEFYRPLGTFQPSQEIGHVVVLPKRGPNLERIIICKLSFKTSEEDYIDIERCILTAVSTAILMYVKDYNSVCQVLVDFKGVKISHLQKLNLNNIHKLYNMYENAFKFRISSLDLIHAPHLATLIFQLSKLILKPKLISRIQIHEDLASLQKKLGKEYLTRDYGGELESVEELTKIWDKIIETEQDFFNRLRELADRSKIEDCSFGVQGSFKSLNID
jgi:hypothetical protein